MKKLLLLAPALLLAACAPTQGQKPVKYAATPSEILAAIAMYGPSVQPTRAHNYFGVIETTPTQVTLQASSTTIFALAGGNQPVTVVFTALPVGNATMVSYGFRGNSGSPAANDSVQSIFQKLNAQFQQVP